jgi:photosystem II stability/assembly factor-like uncharacterized protein
MVVWWQHGVPMSWRWARRVLLMALMPTLGWALAVVTSASADEPAVSWQRTAWFWGSPLPRGVDLNSVALVGDRGYAGGFEGVLLRTDDGGRSWIGLEAPSREDIRTVAAPAADTLILTGCERAFRSDDGGASFRELAARPRNSGNCIAKAVFPSSSRGFVLLEDGTVRRSDDGGESFSAAAPLPGEGRDIEFVDERSGFASVLSQFPTVTIYRTTDGGASWSAVAQAGSGAGDIALAGPGVVYALAGGGLLRSDDGGETWISRPLAGRAPEVGLDSVSCVSADRCLLAGVVRGRYRLLVTSDGGATASELAGTEGAYVAASASEGRVVAVGELGATLVSDDGGLSFQPVGGGWGPLVDRPLRTAGDRGAYAPTVESTSELIRTRNGGRSWSFVELPLGRNEFVKDHWYATPRTGMVLALRYSETERPYRARLLRTDDAGSHWRTVHRGDSRSLAAVAMLTGRRVLAAGPRGLRLSVDGGRRFRRPLGVGGSPLSSFDSGRGIVAAYGPRAIAVSRDGGNTWRRHARPAGRLADVDFVDRQVGYLVTRAGALYKTTEGGRGWRRLLGAGPRAASGVSFADRRNGYLDVSSPRRDVDPYLFGDDSSVARLLRTSDGGRSWRPQFRVAGNRVRDIAALTPRAAVLASGGDLAWTATGGDASARTRLTLAARRSRHGPGRVAVSGRLSPARGGERVEVSLFSRGRWRSRRVAVDSDGRFALDLPRFGPAVAVAHWVSDGQRRGAGTRPLRIAGRR